MEALSKENRGKDISILSVTQVGYLRLIKQGLIFRSVLKIPSSRGLSTLGVRIVRS
jgi:hypothetical protein